MVVISTYLVVIANGGMFRLVASLEEIAGDFGGPRTVPSIACASFFAGAGMSRGGRCRSGIQGPEDRTVADRFSRVVNAPVGEIVDYPSSSLPLVVACRGRESAISRHPRRSSQ